MAGSVWLNHAPHTCHRCPEIADGAQTGAHTESLACAGNWRALEHPARRNFLHRAGVGMTAIRWHIGAPAASSTSFEEGNSLKRIVALCAALLVALGVVVSASAYTKAPSSPTHSLVGVCLKYNQGQPYALGGYGDNAGSITAGSPLYLRIGYGAATQKEVLDFLNKQSGTVTIQDSTGAQVASTVWSTGDTSYWAAPAKAKLVTTGGNPITGFAATAYVPMGPAPASGNYTVNADIELAGQVFDGQTYEGPGTWFSTTGCPMTVQ
jgi:hypothetical protein